jgi:hypothetical protein
LRSWRETLSHLERLRMINSDGPEVSALKQSIREHIRELEQRNYPPTWSDAHRTDTGT